MNDPSAKSVTHWIEALKRGEGEAATALWQRYFERLAHLARQKLGASSRRVADEEDVALSVFDCLCRGAAGGQFPDLAGRDDLWRLLTTLTLHKVVDQKRRDGRKKRGAGAVLGETAFDQIPGSPRSLDQFLAQDPTPEFLAMLADEHRRLLDALPDDTLRQVAVWKMEGFTNDEIAGKLTLTRRSVERKLQRIRSRWRRSLAP